MEGYSGNSILSSTSIVRMSFLSNQGFGGLYHWSIYLFHLIALINCNLAIEAHERYRITTKLLRFRALFTKQYHGPLSSRTIPAFIRRIRVQNVLSGNNFCPVKVRARKMYRCNKIWMQSSASPKDFLVEIVSQLYTTQVYGLRMICYMIA